MREDLIELFETFKNAMLYDNVLKYAEYGIIVKGATTEYYPFESFLDTFYYEDGGTASILYKILKSAEKFTFDQWNENNFFGSKYDIGELSDFEGDIQYILHTVDDSELDFHLPEQFVSMIELYKGELITDIVVPNDKFKPYTIQECWCEHYSDFQSWMPFIRLKYDIVYVNVNRNSPDYGKYCYFVHLEESNYSTIMNIDFAFVEDFLTINVEYSDSYETIPLLEKLLITRNTAARKIQHWWHNRNSTPDNANNNEIMTVYI